MTESIPRNRKIRIIIYGLFTLLIMAMIYGFSAQTGDDSGGLSDWLLNSYFVQRLLSILPRLSENGPAYDLRKYAHMTEFFLLCLSSFLFFFNLFPDCNHVLIFLLDFLFCFLYACFDEWHQTFIPQRSGNVTDVLIDCCGILFGLLIHVILLLIDYQSRNESRKKGSDYEQTPCA